MIVTCTETSYRKHSKLRHWINYYQLFNVFSDWLLDHILLNVSHGQPFLHTCNNKSSRLTWSLLSWKCSESDLQLTKLVAIFKKRGNCEYLISRQRS